MRVSRHVEADREILFGRGALEAGRDLLGESYTLLTTPRALAQAPALGDRAVAVVDVPSGPVEEVAAALLAVVDGARIVALGGGRVIDAAKAVAAAQPPRLVIAVPTTLSAAEMTGVHRHARGVADQTPRVRAAVVLNDPALSASAPVERLAASSANALGHALVAIASLRTSPLSAAVARDAVRRLAAGWARAEPDRDQLALGALLGGWAVDHSGLGLHHVVTQSAVRSLGVGHAEANAILLPLTVLAVARRVPEAAGLEGLARDLCDRSGVAGIPALATAAGADALERTVRMAAARPELDRIPPPPNLDELRELYRRAT